MFDMGFTEIILIAIVALLFIGPDKLPDTLRSIARGLGKLKRMFDDTKQTITNELQIDELKSEALKYKQELEGAKDSLTSFKNIAAKEANEIKSSVENSVSEFKNVKSITYDDFEDDEFFDDKYFQIDDDDDDFDDEPKKVEKKDSKEKVAKDSKNKKDNKSV